MKQIVQNYKSGELQLIDVPAPVSRGGGVLVRTLYSVVSTGTEMMKVSESKLSLVGKARARPDQLKKVLRSVSQQGLAATYKKVMNRLDSYTPLGYSLAGEVIAVGEGAGEFRVGQIVACAGNQYALHAEFNWVPVNLCVPVPDGVPPEQAAFATIAAIALQGMRQAQIALGESACIIGLGLLGQILTRLLRGAGVTVFGVDPVVERCRLAEDAGASLCAAPADAAEFIRRARELTGGHGVDCVFIVADAKDNTPVEIAAEIARDRARVVDVGKSKLDLPWNAYYEKELDVRFSRSYGPGRYDPVYEELGVDYPIGYVRWTERRNIDCILGLLAEKRVDFAPLISRVFPFEQAVQVYEDINGRKVGGLGILFKYDGGAPVASVVRTAAAKSAIAGRIRLGVVGAGNYASSMLLPHLAKNSDAVMQAVATLSPVSAANAQRKFGFNRASTDPMSVLQADDVDAVVIATRHATHAELVATALAAGKAVFVEKPLAIDADSLQIVEAAVAESGNDRLAVGFNRRFSPLLNRLKADWGARGGSHKIQYRINADPLEKNSWYLRSETEGTRFVGEGGHFIDTVSWWLGADPVRVSADAALDDPDDLTATFAYPDGSVATISYWTKGDPRLPKERIEIFGDGKAAVFDNFGQYELWREGRKTVVKERGGIDKGQNAELQAFVAAVKSGGPMPIAFGSLVATTRATLATQPSATAAAWLSLVPADVDEAVSAE